MNYWLMKTEPGTYSWEDLIKDKKVLEDAYNDSESSLE